VSAMSRRTFLRTSALGLAVTATGSLGAVPPHRSRVSLVRADDGTREEAIRRAVELVGVPDLQGKRVVLKPNFNSAHPFPGSTHEEALAALVRLCREWGGRSLTVADRSGMGSSRQVMEEKGVFELAERMGFEALPLEDLPPEGWVHVTHPELHWSRGFYLGRVFREADAIVQTCCLKTHRFGGHFTLSLKNTVGMVARQVPGVDHDFMREMHGSPDQRRMIAELNLAYEPAVVVLDAVEGFTSRGPEDGPRVRPRLVLASRDRVALDAVGVAILRDHGTTEAVSAGPVFGQEQIARAVELGLGVGGPDGIELVPGDEETAAYARRLRTILDAT